MVGEMDGVVLAQLLRRRYHSLCESCEQQPPRFDPCRPGPSTRYVILARHCFIHGFLDSTSILRSSVHFASSADSGLMRRILGALVAEDMLKCLHSWTERLRTVAVTID